VNQRLLFTTTMLLLGSALSCLYADSVTSVNPAWILLPNSVGPNTGTWALAANLANCGVENEPTCEPTGDFIVDHPFTGGLGYYVIIDNDNNPVQRLLSGPCLKPAPELGGPDTCISDYVIITNTGPGGTGEIKFYSDPNIFPDVTGLTNLGVLCSENSSVTSAGPPFGCVGTFHLTTTDGSAITVDAASDSEVVFDPFGFNFDSSDQIRFTGITPIGPVATQEDDVPYQVRYTSNLSYADSAVIITNTGASATAVNPVTAALNGNLCVNVYTFSPDEQLISCCSCHVTPNAVWSLSARNDLISNTLTPGVPTSVVVKLLASLAGPAGSSGPGTATSPTCNAATVTATGATGSANLVTPGLGAWGTTVHALGTSAVLPAGGTTPPAGTSLAVVETPFTPATLSAAELTRITTLCGFIQGNGTGFGICKACRFGGLGSVSQ
jgi:hypothetical protein